jgi:hypothetical protein
MWSTTKDDDQEEVMINDNRWQLEGGKDHQ